MLTATHIINRLPHAALKFEAPLEKLLKKPVNYDELRVFGCLAMAYNSNHGTDKFAPRGIPCIFVGYPVSTKGYRLLNLTTMPLAGNPSFKDQVDFESIAEESGQSQNDEEDNDPLTDEHTEKEEESDIADEISPETEQVLRRSTRVSRQPTWLADFVTPNSNMAAGAEATSVTPQLISPTFSCFLVAIEPQTNPLSFNQAVKSKEWIDAMNLELDTLEVNGTWEVTSLPPNRKAIGCKWIYKTKYRADVSIDKHKAHLVILGYKQTYGIDYVETFAPVAKMTTVRSMLAVAAMKNWHVHQLDVSNAFLNGDLNEVVYMTLPLGYTGHESRIDKKGIVDLSAYKHLVCRLIKALYGLRQASRKWHYKLAKTLTSIGFSHSKADYSLYSKVTEDSITLVLIYMENILISGNCLHSINDLKNTLSSRFHIKDMGPVSYFLGLKIDRSKDGFFVSQRKYVLDLLKDFGMINSTPLKLPMDMHMVLTPDKGDLLPDPHNYQRLLGKLIYLTITRPDLSFPVHNLAQFMQRPPNIHMQAAKRILRYLLSNPAQGILLASSSASQLTVYCDSDWASCPTTRKSTSGYCVMLGESPIS